MKKRVLYAAGAILVTFFGSLFLGLHWKNGDDYRYVKEDERNRETQKEITDPKDIWISVEGGQAGGSGTQTEEYCVFVCGQVKEEGICHVSAGSRVDDVIRLAGGFTEEADRTYWNLAQFVYDGQRIYVPKAGEAMPYPDGNNAYDGLGRLDLNAATAEMLKELPGIGEKRASDIIGYREKNGRFTSVEQLQDIPGLKGTVYQGMKDLVCVR